MSPAEAFRKLLLGAVAVVPAFTLATHQARAEVLADAILVLDNFVLASDAAGTPYTDDDISILSATNFANTGGVGLTSVPGFLTQVGSNGINLPGDTNADVNLTGIGEGASPVADDAYTPVAAPPTNHYAYADADVNGTSIQIGGNPAGVLAQTQTSSGLLSSDTGDTDANTGLQATFQAAASGELWIDFDYLVSLTAFVSADAEIADASTIARSSWNISIQDNTDTTLSASLNPNELNQSRGRDEVSDGLLILTDSGHLALFLIDLVAGHQYGLTITHEVFADTQLTLQEVSEPSALLLFGSGLVILALVGHRRGTRRRTSPD